MASPSASSTLFYNDFSNGDNPCWITYGGTWGVSNGQFNETDNGYFGGKAVYQCAPDAFTNFTFDTYVTLNGPLTSGHQDAGVLLRVSNAALNGADGYNGYYAGISALNYVTIGVVDGSWHEFPTYSMPISIGVQYHLRVKAVGSLFQVFVTNMNAAVLSVSDASWTTGMIGLRQYGVAASWDNVLISRG